MSETAQVAAAGVRFRVHRRASGGDSAVPPLLLLHGPGDTGGTLLAAAGSYPGQVLAPDLPGWGGSELTGDLRPVAVAAGLAALVVHEVDRLGWAGPVDVAGHDLGGLLAAALAAARPDLVRRLVLVSSAPGHPVRHAAVLLSCRAGIARSYAWALLGGRSEAPPEPTPARALVLWGSADRLVPQWAGEQLTRQLAARCRPGAVSMAVLPGVGHRPLADAGGLGWAALAGFCTAP